MEEQNALQEVKEHEIVKFDYNSVDQETATYLKDKAKRILDVRMKSIIAIGKELKDAQDRLANHKNGTFSVWCESLGIKRSTAYNYIQAHGYIVQNLDNISDPEKIQQSLLFAVSKPSAPAELQQAVLNGDITTHKEYKELEKKLQEAEQELNELTTLSKDKIRHYSDKIADYERQLSEIKTLYNQSGIQIQHLNKQLEEAHKIGASTEELKRKLQQEQEFAAEKEQEITELSQKLSEIKSAPTKTEKVFEIIEKEVIPADYEDIKKENQLLVDQKLQLARLLQQEKMLRIDVINYDEFRTNIGYFIDKMARFTYLSESFSVLDKQKQAEFAKQVEKIDIWVTEMKQTIRGQKSEKTIIFEGGFRDE